MRLIANSDYECATITSCNEGYMHTLPSYAGAPSWSRRCRGRSILATTARLEVPGHHSTSEAPVQARAFLRDAAIEPVVDQIKALTYWTAPGSEDTEFRRRRLWTINVPAENGASTADQRAGHLVSDKLCCSQSWTLCLCGRQRARGTETI